jgi:hypothetical protein
MKKKHCCKKTKTYYEAQSINHLLRKEIILYKLDKNRESLTWVYFLFFIFIFLGILWNPSSKFYCSKSSPKKIGLFIRRIKWWLIKGVIQC